MSVIHIVLQGKGGVGKSMIAALLAQYHVDHGKTPICIDTDPVNATFSGYKELQAIRLPLLENDEINTRHFDKLIEHINDADADVIVDNGAASFVPLSHYLISNHVPSLLQEMGHELIVHTVITGGQALLDTVSGFSQMVQQFPATTNFIAWLNPYWGKIEHEGKSFEEMKAYASAKDRLLALIALPTLKAETFGIDFSEMLQRRQLFSAALADSSLSIMERQRLKITKEKIYTQLNAISSTLINPASHAA